MKCWNSNRIGCRVYIEYILPSDWKRKRKQKQRMLTTVCASVLIVFVLDSVWYFTAICNARVAFIIYLYTSNANTFRNNNWNCGVFSISGHNEPAVSAKFKQYVQSNVVYSDEYWWIVGSSETSEQNRKCIFFGAVLILH